MLLCRVFMGQRPDITLAGKICRYKLVLDTSHQIH